MDLGFAGGDSIVHQLDPRTRVLAAVSLSVLLAVSGRIPALCIGLAAAVSLAALARLDPMALLKRLFFANAFFLLLWLILPITTEGEAVRSLGPFIVTREGLLHALAITLKGNAILLVSMALLATIDAVALGHALHHLRVPVKLIHILLFTVRYFGTLRREYQRLREAMKVRCFRPRTNRHTYRTYGYLVGMLLVNSFERAERIMNAMRCRGFKGEFYVLRHFAFSGRDAAFACVVAGLLAMVGYLEWAAMVC